MYTSYIKSSKLKNFSLKKKSQFIFNKTQQEMYFYVTENITSHYCNKKYVCCCKRGNKVLNYHA